MIITQLFQTPIDAKLIDIFTMQERSTLNHAHKEIELIYLIKGTLRVKVRDVAYQLNKQDFLIINSNEPHSFVSNADNLFIIIHFNYLQLSSLLSQENIIFACNSSEVRQAESEQLRRGIEELLSVYLKQPHSSVVEVLEKAFKLISILQSFYLKSQRNVAVNVDSLERGNSQRLNEILGYIQANFREPLSLEEVASVQYITVPYLSKFFKKQTGKTFSQYVNKVRLAYAVNELVTTNKSITRIALDNGFPNLAAFNRVFNDHYQEKPVEYRKKKMQVLKREENSVIEEAAYENNEVLQELRYYLKQTEAQTVVLYNMEPNRETHIIKMGKMKAFTKYWNKMINLGYATDLLSSDMQEQVVLLQNELGFTYGRFWGVFSDEMHIEDCSGESISYNFSNVNKVLDFLVNHRLKPYIELGPKPKILSKKFNHSLFLQTSGKKTLAEWRGLIKAFLLNCVERYSVEEVETWYFEIWSPEMDPMREQRDEEQKRSSNRHNPGQFEEYFTLFGCLKTVISEIVPTAKVGGCGLTMDLEKDRLEFFLKQWKEKDVHPDFLSVYLYPIELDSNSSNIKKKNVLSVNPDYIQTKLKQVTNALEHSGFENLELNVTEWNISISNRELLNDSCFKATYIAKNIIDNLNGYVNMMGYWTCSDIFSDFKDAKSLIYGGAGLLTKSGIRKPSYHSFMLLKQLGEILVAKGKNYIVTKKSGDRYQIICFNYKHFDYAYYLYPEGTVNVNEQYDIFEDNEELRLSLEIQGVSNGKYRIKERKINRCQGSVLDEWLNFGSVDDIKPDEVNYLKQKCVPYMKVDHAVVDNNSVILTGELQPHEVRLYELTLLFRG
ncbi:GH39 family glycosyl hydrolase [Priestia megaterium]|uniref:GH39 family glycosyl hydrolase n=1 Tax=Priestia megaterium TaxID=1404 RepID=UPI0030021EA5